MMTSETHNVGGIEISDPGCQNMVGYETIIDASGICTVTLEVEARHLNRHGILHGGMVATVMDVACGNTAAQYFDPDGRAALGDGCIEPILHRVDQDRAGGCNCACDRWRQKHGSCAGRVARC